MQNLLNLKKKDPSDIVYVEKIVLKERGGFSEVIRALVILVIASGIVWGFSNADTLIEQVVGPARVKNFNAVGIVSDVASTTISIDNAQSSDKNGDNSFTFDITNVSRIENANYVQMTLADIAPGDKIILQGQESQSGSIDIKRIISFSTRDILPFPVVATTTATTTATSTVQDVQTVLDVGNVNSTPDVSASSSESTSTTIITSTTTPTPDSSTTATTITSTTTEIDVGNVLDVGNATSTTDSSTTPTSTTNTTPSTSDSSSGDSSSTGQTTSDSQST